MPDGSLKLRRAVPNDMNVIIVLIEERASWLRTQGTDQWARPWPSRSARDDRIRAHLDAGKTWLVENGNVAVATISIDSAADAHWPDPERGEPALYIHRLVVNLSHAGQELGAQLLDWAGQMAARDYQARWIRVNAWTTNQRLHKYYRQLGFLRLSQAMSDATAQGYPSAALFQRPSSLVMSRRALAFSEVVEPW